MVIRRALSAPTNEYTPRIMSLDDPTAWLTAGEAETGKGSSLKVSAVNRAVAVLSDSMSKMPVHIYDGPTRKRISNHPLMRVLSIRPNEAMAPSVLKKLCENNRLLAGNAYCGINRNPYNGEPVELIPLRVCTPYFDDLGRLWYVAQNPRTGEMRKLPSCDVLHYKACTENGIVGVSVLTYAAEVIANARATQQYEGNFFTKNAQPGGVIEVEGDVKADNKEKIRKEWERIHKGIDNAFRIAVLDMGMKYHAIGISNKDAQFVESKAVTVEDIARFFGVPLYKLFTGKQSYNSNEQNGIEYVVGTLHPIVAQCDEEDSYKLLFTQELRRGNWIARNMMAELKGDTASRAQWYRTMREISVYSPNDICELEDRPDVPGGESRYASLNFIPLEDWRELSTARNKEGGGHN